MKIACCTMEMIALIFMLFVSINGGLGHRGALGTELVNRTASELVSVWGEPTRIETSSNASYALPDRGPVEVWTYDNPARFVIVRDNVIVAVRYV